MQTTVLTPRLTLYLLAAHQASQRRLLHRRAMCVPAEMGHMARQKAALGQPLRIQHYRRPQRSVYRTMQSAARVLALAHLHCPQSVQQSVLKSVLHRLLRLSAQLSQRALHLSALPCQKGLSAQLAQRALHLSALPRAARSNH